LIYNQEPHEAVDYAPEITKFGQTRAPRYRRIQGSKGTNNVSCISKEEVEEMKRLSSRASDAARHPTAATDSGGKTKSSIALGENNQMQGAGQIA
jgi:hypothetical protein